MRLLLFGRMKFPLLLLVLIACGGGYAQPPQTSALSVRASVEAPPEAVCEFEGSWSGTLHFADDADVHVSSRTADARLFPSRLEAHVSGGGWHLRGEARLGEDHVLRLQQAAWLGEGVAVDAGLHVAVDEAVIEAGAGRVRVRPHPSTVENIVFTEAPGRWLGCESVGLAEQSQDRGPLMLPESTESLEIGLPFSLSHTAAGAPFAEVRPNDFEAARPTARITVALLERRGDSARIRVMRYGGGSNVVLVGWVDAARLSNNTLGGGGMALGGLMTDTDHEECTSPNPLALFIEGASGHALAGDVDAATSVKVLQRNEEWAEVRPLGFPFSLSSERRFFVPSATLQCVAHRGTHVRETLRVQVNAAGLACGAQCECELRLTRLHQGQGTCQARLQCGAQVVFGDASSNGYFGCVTQEGHVTGADTEPSEAAHRGDPRFSVDGDIVTASDEESGQLGAFRLEGRIVR